MQKKSTRFDMYFDSRKIVTIGLSSVDKVTNIHKILFYYSGTGVFKCKVQQLLYFIFSSNVDYLTRPVHYSDAVNEKKNGMHKCSLQMSTS